VDTAPKASGCFSGGTQEIFGGLSEDLLGGTGKAEDAKLQGAGIIPKLCPMERVGTETMNQDNSHLAKARTRAAGDKRGVASLRLGTGRARGADFARMGLASVWTCARYLHTRLRTDGGPLTWERPHMMSKSPIAPVSPAACTKKCCNVARIAIGSSNFSSTNGRSAQKS
jgi:hypothetical protein